MAATTWAWPRIWANEQGGWWRMALTFALLLAGAGVGVMVDFALVPAGSRAAMGNPSNPATLHELGRLFAGLLPKAMALAGLLGGIRFVHKQPVARVFTDGRPFNIAIVVQSAALWALLWFSGQAVQPHGWEHLIGRAREIPAAWWPVLSLSLLGATAVAITLEEVLFRGYLQTRLAAWLKRPWLAAVLVALLFTGLHTGADLAAITAIAFAAILFGAAVIRAGSLAPVLGMHITHDLLATLWYPNDTNAGATWLDVAVWEISLCIWFAWLLWITAARPDADAQSSRPL